MTVKNRPLSQKGYGTSVLYFENGKRWFHLLINDTDSNLVRDTLSDLISRQKETTDLSTLNNLLLRETDNRVNTRSFYCKTDCKET